MSLRGTIPKKQHLQQFVPMLPDITIAIEYDRRDFDNAGDAPWR
jgi:hypothetical protein